MGKTNTATASKAENRQKVKGSIYRRFLKRAMDVFLSLIAIIVLSPVLLIIALLVRIKLGSPVIFKQKRPGLHEKIFTLCKFRTMTDKRNMIGELLSDEVRLTKFGKMLRNTSLDELPELFNIFIGDMSFVGPRPLLIQYLLQYNEKQKRRHEARPGLTGLAQINGRNAISWENKFDFDVRYIDNICLSGDIKIFFLTFRKVFVREGIHSETAMTMEIFRGTNTEDKNVKEELC